MNATDVLRYGQLTAMQAIEGFPETTWETPGAYGVWSVKDIIAHFASYELVLVDILSTFTMGTNASTAPRSLRIAPLERSRGNRRKLRERNLNMEVALKPKPRQVAK